MVADHMKLRVQPALRATDTAVNIPFFSYSYCLAEFADRNIIGLPVYFPADEFGNASLDELRTNDILAIGNDYAPEANDRLQVASSLRQPFRNRPSASFVLHRLGGKMCLTHPSARSGIATAGLFY